MGAIFDGYERNHVFGDSYVRMNRYNHMNIYKKIVSLYWHSLCSISSKNHNSELIKFIKFFKRENNLGINVRLDKCILDRYRWVGQILDFKTFCRKKGGVCFFRKDYCKF